MNKELWDFQQAALDNIRASIGQGVRRIVCQSPTGSGKTVLASAIVEGAQRKNNRLAFVVNAISLIDQTVEAFYREDIRDVGVIQANHIKTDWSRPVQVCSVQTLKSRGAFPEAKIVVFDECHSLHAVHKQWLAHPDWQNVPFIGLSATPWSRGLGQYFQSLLVAATTRELIDRGFLSKFTVYACPKADLSQVKITAGDYQKDQLSDAMLRGTLSGDVVKTWKERWGKDKTLVFGVDRAHAETLHMRFTEAGVRSAYQDGETPAADREGIKRGFHNGTYQIVCNIGTLTTGVDWDVRCLVLARPTKSEILYCLDSETEILTSHGWCGIGTIKEGDCAATDKGWSRVKAVVERDMAPDEKWIEYNAPRSNFRVTDQHNMLFHAQNEDGYRIAPAVEMLNVKGSVYMPTAVEINQPGVPLTDAEIYFVGMMMTDGSWTSTSGSITQSERHPAILGRIEACLQQCGIGYGKRRIKYYPNSLSSAAVGHIIERHPRWSFHFSAGKPKASQPKGWSTS